MVPRYYVFMMEQCYPFGGMDDLEGAYDNIQDALDHAMSRHRHQGAEPDVYLTRAQVLDRDSMKTILDLRWEWFENCLPSIELMLFDEAEEVIFRQRYASCFEEDRA
ncbi:hypothetical protein [uncultured Sphingomonas sp.]|uniref:hypothetical protein n=1 Tax=uncultured Sphingomonas sp. TaxID=158754 RepID=UPI0025E2C780|nr:hypothetical protein [uncultured Sphingomonas sp.]